MSTSPLGRARFALALPLAALVLSACAGAVDAPRVHDGVLDLSDWNFVRQGIARFDGEWQICWNAFVEPGTSECPTGEWQTFPALRLWSDASVSSPIGGRGIASYRVRVALPPNAPPLALRVGSPFTAHRLWLNGEERGGAGRPARGPGHEIPKLENRQYGIAAGASQLDVLVHVSNHSFRGGGLRRPWYLGLEHQIDDRNGYELLLYAAFVSTSVIIGLIFLAQFAFRPSETARGWLGLVSTLVGLRIIPGSTSDVYQLLGGWNSFEGMLRLEYANTALVIFAGAGYIAAKVPDVVPPRIAQIIQFGALALVPIQALAPFAFVPATLPVVNFLSIAVVGVGVASYGRAYARGREGVGSTVVVLSVFSIGILHDVGRTLTGFGAPLELFPYFVVATLASEAGSMLRTFSRKFAYVEDLTSELRESNFELQETEEAVVRFVPFGFLRSLGVGSIREVQAGDHVDADVTVMSFECARGTKDFESLNDFVGRAAASIKARGGFLGQQVGDRMLALFPGDADEALDCALEIHAISPFAVGIASGPVALGAVGAGENLAAVALGPAVDTARLLRDESARRDREVLVGGSARERLRAPSNYSMREVPRESRKECSREAAFVLVGRANRTD